MKVEENQKFRQGMEPPRKVLVGDCENWPQLCDALNLLGLGCWIWVDVVGWPWDGGEQDRVHTVSTGHQVDLNSVFNAILNARKNAIIEIEN